MNKVRIVKMLDNPSFAPGKNRGGNKFSSVKEINDSATKTPNVAIRLALNLLNS